MPSFCTVIRVLSCSSLPHVLLCENLSGVLGVLVSVSGTGNGVGAGAPEREAPAKLSQCALVGRQTLPPVGAAAAHTAVAEAAVPAAATTPGVAPVGADFTFATGPSLQAAWVESRVDVVMIAAPRSVADLVKRCGGAANGAPAGLPGVTARLFDACVAGLRCARFVPFAGAAPFVSSIAASDVPGPSTATVAVAPPPAPAVPVRASRLAAVATLRAPETVETAAAAAAAAVVAVAAVPVTVQPIAVLPRPPPACWG